MTRIMFCTDRPALYLFQPSRSLFPRLLLSYPSHHRRTRINSIAISQSPSRRHLKHPNHPNKPNNNHQGADPDLYDSGRTLGGGARTGAGASRRRGRRGGGAGDSLDGGGGGSERCHRDGGGGGDEVGFGLREGGRSALCSMRAEKRARRRTELGLDAASSAVARAEEEEAAVLVTSALGDNGRVSEEPKLALGRWLLTC